MRTAPRLLLASVLLLGGALMLLPGCLSKMPWGAHPDDSMPAAGDYVRSEPFEAEDFLFVWERTKMRLAAGGYRVDEGRTSLADREMVTGWRTRLAPSRYKGKRRRVWVEFENQGASSYVAVVAVQSQRNAELSEPTNPVAADWEDEEADASRAGVLAYQIESDFKK